MRRAETLEIDRGPADLVADLNVSGQGEMVAASADGAWVVVCTQAGAQLFDLETLAVVGEPFGIVRHRPRPTANSCSNHCSRKAWLR